MDLRAFSVAVVFVCVPVAFLYNLLEILYGGCALWTFTILVCIFGVWTYKYIEGTVTGREAVIVGASGAAFAPLLSAFIGVVVIGRPVISLFERFLPEKGVGISNDPSVSLFALVGSAAIAGVVGAIGGSIGGAIWKKSP